jgi:hypothetical protein
MTRRLSAEKPRGYSKKYHDEFKEIFFEAFFSIITAAY